MAGHSKWHSIRHKKAANDVKRGKVLTKHSKILMVLARNDANPDTNASLRSAIVNAKSDGVPRDNSERILKKASGEGKDGAQFTEQLYEGFGPDGVPVLIQALTDNSNRTLPEVRTAFDKAGGNFGSSGSVRFLFDHLGVIHIKTNGKSEDQVFDCLIEAGADNFEYGKETCLVMTQFEDLGKVRTVLESDFEIEKAEPIYQAKDPILLASAKKIESFIERIEEVDDVDEVFAGFQVSVGV